MGDVGKQVGEGYLYIYVFNAVQCCRCRQVCMYIMCGVYIHIKIKYGNVKNLNL